MVHFADPSAALRLRTLSFVPQGVRWFHEPGAWVERRRHAPSAPPPLAAAPGRIASPRRHDRR